MCGGIEQFALIGLSRSLHSEAWLVRGGDPAVCSHRVEQLAAFSGLTSARRRSSSLHDFFGAGFCTLFGVEKRAKNGVSITGKFFLGPVLGQFFEFPRRSERVKTIFLRF